MLVSGQALRKRSKELSDKCDTALDKSTKAIREGLRLQRKTQLAQADSDQQQVRGDASAARFRSEKAVQVTKSLESRQAELAENHRKTMAVFLPK